MRVQSRDKSFQSPSRTLTMFKLVVTMGLGCVLGGLICSILCIGSRKAVPVAMEMTSTEQRAERISKLVEWFTTNGGRLHQNVALRPLTNMPLVWGMFATGPVETGSILIAVPPHLIMTSVAALHSIVHNLDVLRALSSLPPHQITAKLVMEVCGVVGEHDRLEAPAPLVDLEEAAGMVLGLYLTIHFQDQNHFFYPYFSTLPSGCQNSVCWPEAKLNKHLSPRLAKIMLSRQKAYKAAAKILGLDERNFLEKVSLVKSRCWAEKEGEFDSLVPLVDMLNHHPESDSLNNFGGRDLAGAFLEQENALLLAGDEVYDSYGDQNNGQLFNQFGFVMPNNSNDNCQALQSYLSDEFIMENITLAGGIKCEPRPRVPYMTSVQYLALAWLIFIMLSVSGWCYGMSDGWFD
eukprot:gb/GEZN01006544.1/.p1 GENE.gb/GEZN01006544.1/~~gb/GEZN01006544.1/.p1  ORF type:complete len:406 (+),score=43.71 gb/GEZN01006544.1/:110-1327(+)